MSKGSSESIDPVVISLVQAFHNILHPAILAPPGLDWHNVHPRLLRFLCKMVAGTPWVNHLALAVIVMAHAKLNQGTIRANLYALHARWRVLFPYYHLVSFDDWNPVEHIPHYLNNRESPDSFETRQDFLRHYSSSSRHIDAYLRSLPPLEHEQYKQWAFPLLPPDLTHQLSRQGERTEAQQQRRKIEVDALVPHFAKMRGEAHLRWNALQRLQTKFREATLLIETGQEKLPLKFSYEEPYLDQRLHFILWDRLSFVLAHEAQYKRRVTQLAKREAGPYCPERNRYFLECAGTEQVSHTPSSLDTDALLWFGDLLHHNLLGSHPLIGTEEEVKRKQAYLHSWGYEAELGEERCPFRTGNPGLLIWSQGNGDATFFDRAQRRTNGLLLQVEPLFAAATFGLAALDFFTTTGARVSELLQISLTPDCLYTLSVEGSQRLLLRLVPKGTDKPADYIVGTETRRNLEKVAHLLQEHYQLQAGETLPKVSFSKQNDRHHQFKDARPYLFQYNGQHLTHSAITACMRFLCHGMVFQTPEGRAVVLKAHSLRHVFAAHIHHVEQVPLDIVAVMLHQKDVNVTRYYAAPPWQQVLATANSLLDRFATQLGSVEEAFVRAPAELQRQYEEAKQQVGTLAKVPGGECTCHAICPISFACTGCVFKVPDPARRQEIIEQKQLAFVRLEQVKKRGQGPETVKMQALIYRCETEEAEMTLMEDYRKDEQFEPELYVEH